MSTPTSDVSAQIQLDTSIEARLDELRAAVKREIERIDQRLADLRAHVDRAIEICTERGEQK